MAKENMKKGAAREKALADFIENFQHMPKAEKMFGPKEAKVVKIEHEVSAGDESSEEMPEVEMEIESGNVKGSPSGKEKSLLMRAMRKIMMNDEAGSGKGEM